MPVPWSVDDGVRCLEHEMDLEMDFECLGGQLVHAQSLTETGVVTFEFDGLEGLIELWQGNRDPAHDEFRLSRFKD